MGLSWSNTVINNRQLKGSPRLLMMAIADKCFDNSNELEIAVDKLAWLINLESAKQTRRLLDFLVQQKFIEFTPGNGRGKLSKIKILLPKIKVDILENEPNKGGHFDEIKVDILVTDENKGGHFGTENEIKVDIFDAKGGHSPARASKELLPPNTTEQITTEDKKEKFSFEINEVFQFWQNELHPNGKLSPKRKKVIQDRLKDGYSVTQIQKAILACKQSDFHTRNGHTDIELICRSVEKLDGFLARQNGANNGSSQKFNQPKKPTAGEIIASRSYYQNTGDDTGRVSDVGRTY